MSAAFMSSAQAHAHLLCGDCEHRFNDGGEDWVLKNCWRSPTNFPLHSALMGATPFVDEQGFRSYEGKKISGVEIDKMAYFGVSIPLRRANRRKAAGPPCGGIGAPRTNAASGGSDTATICPGRSYDPRA